MNSPRAATWLLKRALRGPHAASLVGDMLERYQSGRSRLWFWRETIVVIALDTFHAVLDQKWRATSAVVTGFVLMFGFGRLTFYFLNSVGQWMWNWTIAHNLDALRVFWFGRPLSGRPINWVMLCLYAGVTGWLIARLHRRQLSMVLLFTVCDFVYVGVQAMRPILHTLRHGPPPYYPGGFPPALAVLVVGVPICTVIGGILASRGELEVGVSR